ncbi:MAG: metallophosphoesterase [Gemmata sp.]
MSNPNSTLVGRRAFLTGGSLVLAGLGPAFNRRLHGGEQPAKDGVRFGLITDLHYADKPAAGTRYYRETLDKLAEAAGRFEKERPAFVVELGDLIDAADAVETELAYLKRVDKEFSAIAKDRHYVLGNHCVDTLTKDEFLGGVGQKKSYYSFDSGGVHFVVLDACFRSDGKPYGRKNSKWTDANVPAAELDWLKEDLKGTDKKVVVLAHQRLDVANDYGVKNAADVRKVLEGSGKVLCVFQGHSHKNDYKDVGGVHYCTLVGMIEGSGAENNGYAVVDVRADSTVVVTGFRKQKGYEWAAAKK